MQALLVLRPASCMLGSILHVAKTLKIQDLAPAQVS
jgi:hypothetical protein